MTEHGGPVARRELLTGGAALAGAALLAVVMATRSAASVDRALARVVDDLERGDPAPEGATVGADDPVPDG